MDLLLQLVPCNHAVFVGINIVHCTMYFIVCSLRYYPYTKRAITGQIRQLRWSKQTNSDICLLAGGASLQRDVQFWKIVH